MKLNLDGKVYEHDEARLLVSELAFIQKKTGMSFQDWQAGLGGMDAMCIKALAYVMKKRAGEAPDWETLDFDILSIFDVGDEAEEETVSASPKGATLAAAS